MRRTIALLSDFGTKDPYVGIAKAVIAGIAPSATLVDLTHDIPPQGVMAGSFVLAAALPYLPDGAVVWTVVDPGVGTSRAAVAVAGAAGGRKLAFVAPDNGLLSESLELLTDVTVVALDDPRFHLERTSATFHGRDVFAPAAAHVARGVAVADVGTPLALQSLVRLEPPLAVRDGQSWNGTIRWVDRFGDLITNLPAHAIEGEHWRVHAGRASIDAVSRTFGSVAEGDDVAYIGSWGTLEIAVRGGSAADRWNLGHGDDVRLTPL